MGRTTDHTCTNCGYTANISGGRDAGMYSECVTVMCRRCKELSDATTRSENSLDDLPLPAPECTKCYSKHVSEWDDFKDSCPKCRSRMARDGYELDELISAKRVKLKCESCGYRVRLVGSAFGVIGRTEAGRLYRSFACPDCRVLFQIEDEIPPYLGMLQEWSDRTPICGSCKSDDVTPWTLQNGCPKCGSEIEDTGRNVVFFD